MNDTTSSVSPARTTVSIHERLDRIDRYCDELEALIDESESTNFDSDDETDITGQIEASVAGLELIDRFGRRRLID